MVKTLSSNAGGTGSILSQGDKFTHVLWPKESKNEIESNIVTHSIKTIHMIHIKKKIVRK